VRGKLKARLSYYREVSGGDDDHDDDDDDGGGGGYKKAWFYTRSGRLVKHLVVMRCRINHNLREALLAVCGGAVCGLLGMVERPLRGRTEQVSSRALTESLKRISERQTVTRGCRHVQR
jgi:hypothetical protein